MTALRLSDFLPDFGRGQHRESEAIAGLDALERLASPTPPAIDMNGIIREEIAKAEAEVTERLSAIYEATLEAERSRHAAELERLHAEYGAEAGATIARGLAEAEAEITSMTTSVTARIVGVLMTEDIRKRAIESLAGSIREAVHDSDAVRIQVSGPQSLFEPLSAALGSRASNLHYVEAPGFDLTVSVDGNLFETRLAEWSAALSGALS